MERALTGLTSKLTSRKSTKDFRELAGGKDWPTDASQYQILDDCGRGVSATVHRARCLPNGAECAVKLMNLESMNCDLDEIIHEAQTMRMYNHPNILPLYCSFVHGQELWMVMPFVSGGSVLHIMKYGYPEGLDEVIIATIGREVLKGLDYVHKNGSIHRDVKAGNILVDGEGNVKLGDFGVAASLERGGSWGHDKQARMTFVGTPCWMAPEVMEQTVGYDFSADIWSFGITLLEMCHGHAPFAKFPPMKVLLMTLQNPAPTLEDKGKRHFSKALKDLVTRCLQKERDKRPTAAQLLEHKFFKLAKDSKYLKDNLVGSLPPLADRVNRIRNGGAATMSVDNERNLEKSQEEYRKGVSSWNFDLAALKAQAALEPDGDESGHGNSMLPTISESDEREDTLTGTSAAEAAAFLAAQQAQQAAAAQGQGGQQAGAERAGSGPAAEPSGTRGYTSAFATMTGQDPTVKTNAVLPLGAGGMEAPAQAPSAPPPPLRGVASGDTIAPERSQTAPEVPPSPGGHASPANALSREGSIGGNMVGMATTPTAVTKQKKGRFEVSEHPPMPQSTSSNSLAAQAAAAASTAGAPAPSALASSSSTGALANSLSSSMVSASGPSISGGTVPDLSGFRASSTGLGPEPSTVPSSALMTPEESGVLPTPSTSSLQPTRTEVEESVTSVEPKQRGRFKIVAEQGAGGEGRPLLKTSSMANLSDAKDAKSRSDGGTAGAGGSANALLGKPPTAPSSIVPNVSVVLPKLQELLDHTAAHQAALQKLIGAVQECDKGRVPLLLSRTQSTKSLFDSAPTGSAALSSPVGEGLEELRLQVLEMRAKMASLEEENTRLRERNRTLEAAAAGQGQAQPQSQSQSAGQHTVRFAVPGETQSLTVPSPRLTVEVPGQAPAPAPSQ
ncbi:hypothetical protein HYH03_002795 [Edaphochlamys debaryana]|uniref:Protein kinase domain-containing protein n=1 Tax=Edaphochlamys debaryana TaxID=47281 RepID=A0A835YA76_9CHLO|nr:hypothetical protein HYH03_002795 [Edaphochlamys debaryana]|eukprot:KAG2499215.1 hypothetical protein HYH03_002795 [Edaphochlamys debaryana]